MSETELFNPFHWSKLYQRNRRIVVDADRPDWAKRWGAVPKEAEGCWCYTCYMEKGDQYPWREIAVGCLPKEEDGETR